MLVTESDVDVAHYRMYAMDNNENLDFTFIKKMKISVKRFNIGVLGWLSEMN